MIFKAPPGRELYHWVYLMNAFATLPWPHSDLGTERALELSRPSARMLFGLGPPGPGGLPEERVANLLEALDEEVQAINWCEQIHGRLVASLAPEYESSHTGVACVGRCDALITDRTGVGLLVWTADCVPVLISGGGVVAAVHSGWRGTVADVVGAVVDRFRTEFGVPVQNLEAALGPSISGPRYEVSHQVIDALSVYDVDRNLWCDGNRVDLRNYIGGRLRQLGVPVENIAVVGPCTAGSPELASYRRDGSEAGRQWSLVYGRG